MSNANSSQTVLLQISFKALLIAVTKRRINKTRLLLMLNLIVKIRTKERKGRKAKKHRRRKN